MHTSCNMLARTKLHCSASRQRPRASVNDSVDIDFVMDMPHKLQAQREHLRFASSTRERDHHAPLKKRRRCGVLCSAQISLSVVSALLSMQQLRSCSTPSLLCDKQSWHIVACVMTRTRCRQQRRSLTLALRFGCDSGTASCRPGAVVVARAAAACVSALKAC